MLNQRSNDFLRRVELICNIMSRCGLPKERVSFIKRTLLEKNDRRYIHYFTHNETRKLGMDCLLESLMELSIFRPWKVFDSVTYNLIPQVWRELIHHQLHPVVVTVGKRKLKLYIDPQRENIVRFLVRSRGTRPVLSNLLSFADSEGLIELTDMVKDIGLSHNGKYHLIYTFQDLGFIEHVQSGCRNVAALYRLVNREIAHQALGFLDAIDRLLEVQNDEEERLFDEVPEVGLVSAAA